MKKIIIENAQKYCNSNIYKIGSNNYYSYLLIEKERNTAQYYTNRLIDFLTFNAPSKFPEYFSNVNEDVYPDKDLFGGWVI